MTFLELQTELLARGFDYLGQSTAGLTRAKRWLNQAYIVDIAEPYPWPDLEATSTSLSITDLKDVIHVLDTTNDNQLNYADSRTLTDMDADYATTTGTAEFWYVTDEGALAVYPSGGGAAWSIRYLKVPAELSADGDTPVLPSRLHPLIVDYAAVLALLDRDNYDGADRLKIHADHRLEVIADSVLHKTSDTSAVTVVAGSFDG